MSLIEISEQTHHVVLDIRYATDHNLTGRPIYKNARAFLHQDAAHALTKAAALAEQKKLRLKIFDAFRPLEAHQELWNRIPDETYVAPPPPGRASNHSRGTAIDLTLVDAQGQELDMGTPFDALEEASHHGSPLVKEAAVSNRLILLNIMESAGFQRLPHEWWHYQLPHSKEVKPDGTFRYPLLSDSACGVSPMGVMVRPELWGKWKRP